MMVILMLENAQPNMVTIDCLIITQVIAISIGANLV
jgi:hypothetical protein